MILLELNKPLPLVTPKGKGNAHFICYYSELETEFLVSQDQTGELWWWTQRDVRLQTNLTNHHTNLSPFQP